MVFSLDDLLVGAFLSEALPFIVHLFLFVSTFWTEGRGHFVILCRAILLKLRRELVILFLKHIELGLVTFTTAEN
jgi:hypothetical protein